MSARSRPDGDHRTTPPNIDVMYSLKVDNLTYRTRVEDLRRCFEKFGGIGDIYIPRDQFSRSSRGYAFIRFLKKRDAEDALDRMDGADLDGREIRVQFARYGRASTTDSHETSRRRRTRSRSRSRRRSKHRSRSGSYRRSRSRSTSRPKRNHRHENGERDHRR
ncbi:unnamed protein product [Rotaria socialis]|uniref:Serine/arginine-rich splicing factor 2 n=1 Tax=Rotaria socialis TaxID=392032 RepID=A0A820YKW4_9BILA|nr:unnamed protein product [Rotaria socialis]CAF3387970.1 unnamed protein product [Rotaria socialis]CAF3488936.1 unnamed protein product [Rotaria socialis]CAF3531206.1 unnamed protein product [Rotaria socialis]CAF3739856.1 unnamed protein product [Rotaria socialis]